MKNNFETFGYTTNKPCEICASKPAKVEPRFGYITCEKHSILTPIGFQKLVDKKINKNDN